MCVFSNNMLSCVLVCFLNRYRQSSLGREWVRREYYLVLRTRQSYWEKTRWAYSTGNDTHYLAVAYDSAAAAAKSLQLCPTLCDPIDESPPGSPVPGILQARILEWVAISFSSACVHAKSLQSCPILCDAMDSSPLAPLSTGSSRQEYWSGLPFPSPYHDYNLQKYWITVLSTWKLI